MKRDAKLSGMQALVGQHLGSSGWLLLDQARIQQFAAATGRPAVDPHRPARAAAGPFGTTFAHGFLTLSLLPVMFETAFTVGDVRMGLN